MQQFFPYRYQEKIDDKSQKIFWSKFNEIYDKIDSDHDGEISFDELIDYLAERADDLGLIRLGIDRWVGTFQNYIHRNKIKKLFLIGQRDFRRGRS